jgi:hypothetical protein
MSTEAAKKLKHVFHRLGRPPAESEVAGNIPGGYLALQRGGRPRKAQKMVQLNLRVPEDVKDRVRILAARDRREMSQIVIEAIELYEAKYGAAPKFESSRWA